MRSCTACQDSSNGPDGFMLTCQHCKRHWHHTCHLPLITERELLSLIRNSTQKLPTGTLETWSCRKCKNRASSANSRASTARLPSSLADASPAIDLTVPQPNTSKNVNHTTVVELDSDEEVQVVSPPNPSNPRASTIPADVIDLLDSDSDDDIVEVVQSPPSTTRPSRTPLQDQRTTFAESQRSSQQHEIVSSPPIAPRDVHGRMSPHHATAPSPASQSRETLASSPRAAQSRTPSVSSQLNHMTLDASVPEHLPLSGPSPSHGRQDSASSSATAPDFRRMIAEMRAQGKLGPTPADQATSSLLAYSSGASAEPSPGLSSRAREKARAGTAHYDSDSRQGPVSPSDSDVDMAENDAHASPPAHDDPFDIEDMYGDEAPEHPPVKTEEMQDDSTALHGHGNSRPAESKLRTFPMWVRQQEQETAEESDEWSQIWYNEAQRLARRKEDGTLQPRKPTKTKMLVGKRQEIRRIQSVQLIDNGGVRGEAMKVSVLNQQQRWASGTLLLDRLYG